jgi:hypothetical protein
MLAGSRRVLAHGHCAAKCGFGGTISFRIDFATRDGGAPEPNQQLPLLDSRSLKCKNQGPLFNRGCSVHPGQQLPDACQLGYAYYAFHFKKHAHGFLNETGTLVAGMIVRNGADHKPMVLCLNCII